MMNGMRRLGTIAALFLALAMPLAADPPSWSSGTYVYDPSGNIVKIGSDRYTYDLLSRIRTSTAGAGHTQTYDYDPFGNITNIVTDGGAPLLPGVNAATNRISTSAGSNAYGSYDAAGNMISYLGLYTYAYDAANMVKEITGPNSLHEVYLYTVDDERIAAGTVSGAGSSATITAYRYTIRGLDNKVLREFDDSLSGSTHTWSWKEDFVYANGQLLATESVPRTLHFFSDHLGTPRLITDGVYNQVARHDYYPFGLEVTSSAQDMEVMKFTGHERDVTLDYMHTRYYGTPSGRFLSIDPVLGNVHAPQSWDRYSYVSNSPITRSDPTGLFSIGADCQSDPAKGDCRYRDDAKDENQRSSATVTVTAKDPGWFSALLFRMGLKQIGHTFTDAEVAAMQGNNYLASYLMRGGELSRMKTGVVFIGPIGGSRVFWSGAFAEDAARAWALENGASTLEMTEAGQALENATAQFGREAMREAWTAAARDWAVDASGEVRVFQSANGVRVASTWATTEYPTLTGNPAVTHIRYFVVYPNGTIVPVP